MDDEPMPEPSEVRDYFAVELRQAELDFPQLRPVSPAHSATRGRWMIVGLGAIVLVGVLVVRSLSTPPSPSGSSGPSAVPSGSAAVPSGATLQPVSTTAASGLPLGADGIPLVVDGQPVLRGSAIAAHVASATDSRSFLIGGEVIDVEIDCASPLDLGAQTSSLLSSCGSGWNLVDGPGLAGLPLVLAPNLPGWSGRTPVVLGVHVHDPRAVECAAAYRTECERAIVVDSVAWTGAIASPAPSPVSSAPTSPGARDPSGIPETFDGQPVAIGLAAVLRAQVSTDASSFLIGGWFGDGSLETCTGGPIGRDPSPLLSGCATVVGGDSPWGDLSWPGPQGAMNWAGHQLPGGSGPSIVRVHTHDPQAAACRADSQARCLGIIVVDDVLWTGDTWTNGGPISVAQAVRRLNALNIIEYEPQANGSLAVQRHVFATPTAAPCPGPWPHEVFELHGDPRFALVAIFPDETARIAAQASLDPSAPGCAADSRVVRPAAGTWIGVHNALVLAYGPNLVQAVQEVLAGATAGQPPAVPFPPATLDESYRVVDDAEAARASGNLQTDPVSNMSGDNWFAAYLQDAYRRFAANALSYSIGPGRPPTSADMGSVQWARLQRAAVMSTARLYVVDHPASTDPALAREVLVAFEEQQPGIDSWGLIVVDPVAH